MKFGEEKSLGLIISKIKISSNNSVSIRIISNYSKKCSNKCMGFEYKFVISIFNLVESLDIEKQKKFEASVFISQDQQEAMENQN